MRCTSEGVIPAARPIIWPLGEPGPICVRRWSCPPGTRPGFSVRWMAGGWRTLRDADAAKLLKLMEALEDLDDVSRVSSNFDIDAATLAEAEA